jgi:hypothetical protein
MPVNRRIRLSVPGSGRKEMDDALLLSFGIGSLLKVPHEFKAYSSLTCDELVRGLPGVYTGDFSCDATAFPIVYKRVKVESLP